MTEKLTSRQIAQQAVRARLTQAALAEVLRLGYERATLNDLAAAAGVSRSTFLRHVGSKEEAVVGGLAAIGDELAARVRARPAAEDDWTALRRTMDHITETQRRDDAGALALTRVIHQNVTLSGAHWRQQVAWRPVLAAAVRDRSPQRSALEASALASAALGCLDAATAAWLEADAGIPFAVMLDEAFGVVELR